MTPALLFIASGIWIIAYCHMENSSIPGFKHFIWFVASLLCGSGIASTMIAMFSK